MKASLDVLGRKWALLVLRNIGLYRTQRFNEMLRITPGLTKRVLAMRLKELERAGFIRAVERGRNYTRWGLTAKGEDALPILMTLVNFGSKWYAEQVFADRRPRSLSDVFERSYIQKTLREMTAASSATPRGRHRPSRPTHEATTDVREAASPMA
ncbi:MAG: helix-turn-helix domain-containing protein [Thermoplasmata archaeon]